MNNDKEIAIHVIDDDPEICEAMRWLFESVELNVNTYESAKKFLSLYTHSLRGCLIIDIRMPYMSGLELLDHLNALENKLPVIVITGHGDIPMAVRAMKAGAIDFILKPINDQDLLETIYKCLHQLPETTKITASSNTTLLTKREQEVVNLIVEGKYNKEIAYLLNISLSTVEAHRARIMDKFQARNLAQLIKKYYQIG